MLGTARRVVECDRLVRSGRWKGVTWSLMLGDDVHGRTLGIIGFGRIGKAIARRAQGFGIWPTLSEPAQVRIGILNQLSPEQITEIVSRFADAMLTMGAEFDKQKVISQLKSYYAKAA